MKAFMTANHHGHDHSHSKSSGKWKPHLDWRIWVVALMLLAMVVYIFTMDEALNPAAPGAGTSVPADSP